MPEHRRTTDDAPEKTVHSRSDDFPKFLRLIAQYRILWLAGMGMAAWIGSRIVQPLNLVGVNSVAIAKLEKRADAKDSTDKEWRDVLKIVVRVQCATLSEGDKYKYNLCHAPETP